MPASRPAAARALALSAALVCLPARAAEWHVSPAGTESGAGTKESPWELSAALGGGKKIAPGDTVWLHGGVYRRPFKLLDYGHEVRLQGAEGAPVHVRALPGARVTIDGGLIVQPPSTHLWLRDLEITVSHPRPAAPVPPDSTYQNTGRPWGGLNVYSGTGCKFINLVIHNNNQGVSWWTGNRDSELYGCLIYDNGWAGTDRGHGHAVYTQNAEGVKAITDCIMTGGYGYTMHAYGSSRADVNGYLAQGNIVYNGGPFLIGGGKPSRDIRVLENLLYGLPMRLGYSASHNEDCEVRDNVLVNSELAIKEFRQVVSQGNLVLGEKEARPSGARVVLRPNRYDPDRAHLAVYNWEKKPLLPVDAGRILKKGDPYRLMDPKGFFGTPLQSGVYDGKAIPLRLTGEFGAYVLLRGR